jgi:hypothetical protein
MEDQWQKCAYVYPVFLGTQWQDNETYVGFAAQLQLFLSDYFASSTVHRKRSVS